MRILLTNDDGIDAPGLHALARAIDPIAEIEIVAPQVCQSATGHAISVQRPLRAVRRRCGDFEGWAVDGRPADCVKLGLMELVGGPPDFVLSGINAGVNTCVNVLYSGTVAAAREAAFAGIPAIAFSLEISADPLFDEAADICRGIVERIAAGERYGGTCLCVNIPRLEPGPPVGFRVCRQSTSSMMDHYRKSEDAIGIAYELDGHLPPVDHDIDDDLAAIETRHVSITPLSHDLTDYKALARLQQTDW